MKSRGLGVLLAIECSGPRASLAVVGDDGLIFESRFESERGHHSALFAPLVEALATVGDGRIDEIVVGTGPGGYSGTRVGIAAAQGVGVVHECRVVGLSSLLALGLVEGMVIGDARRGSAWWATLGGGMPEPRVVAAGELPEIIRHPVYATEDLSRLSLPAEIEIRPAEPSAGELAAAWRALDGETRDRLRALPPQPAYLRPPHITRSKRGHPLLRRRN